MKLVHLLERLPPNGLFRTGQILAGERAPQHVRRQLDRWVKGGRVLRLRRGVYLLAPPYAGTPAHPFAIAGALQRASYVSLHSALAYYGMIPEHVPVTTSISSGRPEELSTPRGRFQFRHLAPRRLFGFAEVEVAHDQRALLAGPEKAVVDLLYLTPYCDQVPYLRELRLMPADALDLAKLHATVTRTGSHKVARAVRLLLGLWREEEAWR